MVPRGLELRTLRLLAVRSSQLSYETSQTSESAGCPQLGRAHRGVRWKAVQWRTAWPPPLDCKWHRRNHWPRRCSGGSGDWAQGFPHAERV